MAQKVLILGASGCGKSTAIQTLDPKSTFILQCTTKQLPFKDSNKLYNQNNKNIYTLQENDRASYVQLTQGALKKINTMQNIKTLIIDDFNYIMTYDYKKKARVDKAFGVFSSLAFDIIDIFEQIDKMRSDLTVYIIAHTQKDNEGKISTKTIGKFLDSAVCIEGLFSIVILALGDENKYQFTVNGLAPAKTPVGMFETNDIPNSLQLINEAIANYF